MPEAPPPPDPAPGHRGSRQKLGPRDLPRFPGPSLFDELGRALCGASALPRKELFESWEVARRVLRRQRGGPVVDLAGGHGLTGWLIALQDRSTPEVTVIDRTLPPSAARVHAALAARWPGVAEKVHHLEADLGSAALPAFGPAHRLVAVHACGALTDRALDLALQAGARVAVLPCCHSHARLDDGGLSGWMDRDLAIDSQRAARLRSAGYSVWTSTIPADITPENRLLIGSPADGA